MTCNLFLQDKSSKLNEINALRIQIEKEYLERVKLEDMIIEKMQAQLTLDKASKYTDKLTQKLRERKKELVGKSARTFWTKKNRTAC